MSFHRALERLKAVSKQHQVGINPDYIRVKRSDLVELLKYFDQAEAQEARLHSTILKLREQAENEHVSTGTQAPEGVEQ